MEDIERLQGSNLQGIARRLQEQVLDDYEGLKDVLQEGVRELLPSLDEYRWALATVWSHSFDIAIHAAGSGESETQRVLIPWIDMFNHDPHCQTVHRYDPITQYMEVIAKSALPAGQQIHLNYGTLANHYLMQNYGFSIFPNHPYPVTNHPTTIASCPLDNDFVRLWAPMHEGAPLAAVKSQILGTLSITNETPFDLHYIPTTDHIFLYPNQDETESTTTTNPTTTPLLEGCRDRHKSFVKLLGALRVQRMEADELVKATKVVRENRWVSLGNELKVYQALREAVEGMLGQYRTSLAEDIRWWVSEASGSTSEERFTTILWVSEKRILNSVLVYLKAAGDKLVDP